MYFFCKPSDCKRESWALWYDIRSSILWLGPELRHHMLERIFACWCLGWKYETAIQNPLLNYALKDGISVSSVVPLLVRIWCSPVAGWFEIKLIRGLGIARTSRHSQHSESLFIFPRHPFFAETENTQSRQLCNLSRSPHDFVGVGSRTLCYVDRVARTPRFAPMPLFTYLFHTPDDYTSWISGLSHSPNHIYLHRPHVYWCWAENNLRRIRSWLRLQTMSC